MVKLLAARYARNPTDSKTALALANAYLMTDQPTKARRLYTKVLKSDPDNETAQVQLAMALHGDGNDAQAFDLLNDVLRSDPRSQLAHYDLASLYFSEQKSSLARDEWKKAAALDPTSGVGKMAQNFVDLMEQNTGTARPTATAGSPAYSTSSRRGLGRSERPRLAHGRPSTRTTSAVKSTLPRSRLEPTP